MVEVFQIFLGFSLFDKILLLILFIAVLIQLVYWIYYSRILSYNLPERSNDIPPVSVIVILNENHLEWINGDMKELFAQNHPNYEVIAVNDCGGEDVSLALQRLYLDNPILRYTSIQSDKKFSHTKKVAMVVGIKCAKFDNLIFIEPWTKPSSSSWLSMMANGFNGGKDIVIGESSVLNEKKNGIGLIRSFNLMSKIRAVRASMAKKPYKASPTNFGFTKQIFYKSNGFNFLKSSYGENDLYLQKIAEKDNFSLVLGHECTMVYHMENSLSEWYDNKKFITSSFRFYPKRVKSSIFWELFSSFLIWIILLISVLKNIIFFDGIDYQFILFWCISLSLVLIRQIVMAILVFLVSEKLDEKKIILSFLGYDIIAAVFESVLSVSRRLGNVRRIW